MADSGDDMIDLRDDKPLWGLKEVFLLSLPAGLSMLTRTLMRFVDAAMVSELGPEPLAAQLTAGMLAFVFESFIMGMLTTVNTYVSQNLGAGRRERCGQYARAGLLLAIGMSALSLPLIFLSEPLFDVLGHSDKLRPLEAMYFRYMIVTIVFGQSAVVLARFFYGIHRPGIVFLAAVIANTFNVGANYVLIFGKLGFPAMGLEGAAIGTLAGTALELLVLLALFLGPRMHALYATRRRTVLWSQCREILALGWPAGTQFASDLLSWGVMTTVLIGRFGSDHLAAHTATVRFISLSFMPAIGIGNACTALVGRYIGKGRPDLAKKRAHAGLILAMAYMGFCGLALFVFRHPFVGFFVKVTPDEATTAAEAARRAATIVHLGGRIMVCAAVFQLFDAANIVYIGALRGAGDTRMPMIMTVILSWSLVVGGGVLAVHVAPWLTSQGPWIAASAFVILLAMAMAWRFESGAWREIELLGREPPPEAELAALTPDPQPGVSETPSAALTEVPNDDKGR